MKLILENWRKYIKEDVKLIIGKVNLEAKFIDIIMEIRSKDIKIKNGETTQ